MNILLCTTRMGIGGAETHVLTLARKLTELGHRVLVLSSGGILENELGRYGIPHGHLPLDRKNPLSLRKNRRGILSAVRDFSPDIIHAHGRIPAFVCGSLRRKKGFPPVVTTVHGMYDASFYKKHLSFWGERSIAVSEDIRDYLCGRYGLKGERTEVIPNGVETGGIARQEHGEFNILMCSRLDPDTVGPVIDVMNLMPALRNAGFPKEPVLTVVGSGKSFGAVSSAARKICAFPGCGTCIRLTGEMTDLSEIRSRTDLFIGSSRSLLEAAAAKIPSVMLSAAGNGSACDGHVTRELMERQACNNFVNRTGTGSTVLERCLRDVIGTLMKDPDAYAGESALCRDYVLKHNDISVTVRETVRFYGDVISGHRPGIMLCGYFGAGNTGDDAVLSVVAGNIGKMFPGAVIYASVSPGYGKKAGNGIPGGVAPIKKTDVGSMKKALKDCRLFVLCGGSLLQNVTSNRSLAYYVYWLKKASDLGCRTMLLGGGIGPVCGKHAERMLSSALGLLDAAGFRDPASLMTAGDFVPDGNFYLSADHALLTEKRGSTFNREGGAVAFCPRNIPAKRGRRTSDSLFRALSATAAEYSGKGCEILWIALSPDDRKLCSELAGTVRGSSVICPESAAETAELLSRCSFSVSVRLHGALLALCSGTPSVCIGYDPKVVSFSKDSAMPCIMPEDISAGSIREGIARLPGKTETAELYRTVAARCAADYAAMARLYTSG